MIACCSLPQLSSTHVVAGVDETQEFLPSAGKMPSFECRSGPYCQRGNFHPPGIPFPGVSPSSVDPRGGVQDGMLKQGR